MMKSNVVANSNVFLIRTDDPNKDPDFVAQIEDYKLLKDIHSKAHGDIRGTLFTEKQRDILKTELRCVYAKNDPCWGYSAKQKRIISACINGECPKIKQCNPKYSERIASYWVTTDDEKMLYGRPDKQPKYYIVDMISDEEMMRYDSDPINGGFEYPVPKNPVLKNKKDNIEPKQKTKIDPKTGRKMVVIGYKWMITDNASYESEELLPIWGFVDETEEKKKSVEIKKAKRIEKKRRSEPEKRLSGVTKDKDVNSDYARKEEFEKSVSESISREIKLTDLDSDYIGTNKIILLLDNPAELSFVSSTLLINGIDHGIIHDADIKLALIDDYNRYSDYENVMISSTAIKSGCKESNVGAWKVLSQRKEIIQLLIADREYYQFSNNGKVRWTCRNMYGVTHVCVDRSDIKDTEMLPDGLYPASIVYEDDNNSFMVVEKNGNLLGHLRREFVDLIDALKQSDEITGSPAVIKGISLNVVNGDAEILGMGNLKFIEY